jgi:hypothetical protein
MRCKWISNLFPSILWSCSSPRSWFGRIKPKLLRAAKPDVMVGEAKPDLRGKELTREVAYEKTPDGRETFCQSF